MDILPTPDDAGNRIRELERELRDLKDVGEQIAEAKRKGQNAKRRAQYRQKKERQQSELEAEHERIIALPRAEQLAWLTEWFGMDPAIEHFTQMAPDVPTFCFELEGGDLVELGTAENLKDPTSLVTTLQAHTPRNYPASRFYFNQAIEDLPKERWKLCLRVMFDWRGPREVWDLTTKAQQLLEEWIPDYLDAKGAHDETDEDRIDEAIFMKRPFRKDGYAYFSFERLWGYLWNELHVKFQPIAFRELLRRAEVERVEKPFRVVDTSEKPKKGRQRRHARRYWRVRIGSMRPRIFVDPREEKSDGSDPPEHLNPCVGNGLSGGSPVLGGDPPKL